MEVGPIGQVRLGSATTAHASGQHHSDRRSKTCPHRFESGSGGSSAEPKTRYYARNRSEGAKREEGHSGDAFRRHTLLPLDDCFHVLQSSLPHLAHSDMQRCFLRHGIYACRKWMEANRNGNTSSATPSTISLQVSPRQQTARAGVCRFVVSDRTGKFACARLVHKAGQLASA